MKQKELIKSIDKKAIEAAIHATEAACSSEIRVHVEPRLRGRDVLDVARRTFERLGMTRTKLRNGVLLFIAAEDQKFAILGDQGIDSQVAENFWDQISEKLTERFRHQQFTEGILEAIEAAGAQLVCHFPIQRGDVNELNNEVTFGDDHSGDHQPRQ